MPNILRHLVILGTLAVPGAVLAQDSAPRLSAIIASLEDQGYTITDIDVDRRVIEVEARTADGKSWDIDIDPATGNVIETREDR